MSRCRAVCSAIVVLAELGAGPARAQSAAAGKRVFEQCAACHSLDGTSGVGPTLQGATGRKAGSVPGFRYSRAMRSAAFTWDASHLDSFLADPQAVVPGNAMPFSGLPGAQDRADLIAYLGELSAALEKRRD